MGRLPASFQGAVGLDVFPGLKPRALIGVETAHWFALPLPPNRTCGSPASGSPVSKLLFHGDS